MKDLRLRVMPQFFEGVILTCLGIHENYEIANSAWHQLEGHDAKFWDRLGREENCPDENVVYMQPDSVIQ
jgi:hypothetical protein